MLVKHDKVYHGKQRVCMKVVLSTLYALYSVIHGVHVDKLSTTYLITDSFIALASLEL